MQDLTVELSSAADAVVVGKCKMEAATIRGSGFAAFKPSLPCITNHSADDAEYKFQVSRECLRLSRNQHSFNRSIYTLQR